MLRRPLFPVFLVAVVAAAALSELGPTPAADAGAADVGETRGVTHVAAPGSLTARAVAAARAFEASLSPAQRETVALSFASPRKATGWSALPTNVVPRNGIAMGDLSASQARLLRRLLRTVRSTRGYAEQVAIRKADTFIGRAQAANPGGNGAGLAYGEGRYFVALFGAPSTTERWMLQVSGHHYTLNLTFSGARVSSTPTFAGVNPRTAFEVDGVRYQPLAAKSQALYGAVQALTPEQQAQARLPRSFDDVLLGAGGDGRFPTAEGILVSTLTGPQRMLVTQAICNYVADMPAAPARKLLATYVAQYERTRLAFSGATDGETHGSYVRLQGPRLWIEMIAQVDNLVLPGSHYHSVERDSTTDYGATG